MGTRLNLHIHVSELHPRGYSFTLNDDILIVPALIHSRSGFPPGNGIVDKRESSYIVTSVLYLVEKVGKDSGERKSLARLTRERGRNTVASMDDWATTLQFG